MLSLIALQKMLIVAVKDERITQRKAQKIYNQAVEANLILEELK